MTECRIEERAKSRYQARSVFNPGDLLKRRLNQIEHSAVRLLCALTLVFVGLAHEFPSRVDSELTATALAHYVLPDGTLPTICVTVVDESRKEHGKIAHLHECEACQINASVTLPAPADAIGAPIGFAVAVELPRRAEAFHRQLFPPNTGPRAPPSNSILA